MSGESALTRAQFVARAIKARADIEQLFVDAAHWNSRHVPWKGAPIDPDPDGQLRRIADGLDRFLAKESAKRATPEGVKAIDGAEAPRPDEQKAVVAARPPEEAG